MQRYWQEVQMKCRCSTVLGSTQVVYFLLILARDCLRCDSPLHSLHPGRVEFTSTQICIRCWPHRPGCTARTTLNPFCWPQYSACSVTEDCLQLKEFFQAGLAPLSAIA